jgi:hypothetical protein
MKTVRQFLSLMLVLSMLISGMTHAAPVAWARGTLPSSMAQGHEDCDQPEVTTTGTQQHPNAQAARSDGRHRSPASHGNAGCCKLGSCPCPSGFVAMAEFPMHFPTAVDIAAIFPLPSNVYRSPAAQRLIKPPIA